VGKEGNHSKELSDQKDDGSMFYCFKLKELQQSVRSRGERNDIRTVNRQNEEKKKGMGRLKSRAEL